MVACVGVVSRGRLSLNGCLRAGSMSQFTQRTEFDLAALAGCLDHAKQHDMPTTWLKRQRLAWRDLYRRQRGHTPLIALCDDIMHLRLGANRAADAGNGDRLCTVIH